MFPILTEYNQASLAGPLNNAITIEWTKVPNFFLIHPSTNDVIDLDIPLDKKEKFSPELILNWAIITSFNIIIKPTEN